MKGHSMDEQQKGLFTVAEAAEAWGITPQAVYQRLTNLSKEGFVVVKGKKRYITREGIEAYKGELNPPYKNLKENKQALPTLQSEIERLTNALQTAEEKASSLQAIIEAQKAHIDSLQAALDKTQTALNQEQTIHMASLQKRLPAPGRGFFAWLRGKKDE